jgi:hypothetical protein
LAVGIAFGYNLDDRFQFITDKKMFFLMTTFIPLLKPTQLPILMVIGAL